MEASTIDLPNKAYLLPESIPMWPPVWWSWLVLALVLFIIATGFMAFYGRHKKRTYRREALQFLPKTTVEKTDKECILLCHELVRRCLISEGKTTLAALPSVTLFLQLDETLPDKWQFSGLGTVFIEGPYRKTVDLDQTQRERIVQVTRYWIRKHHA
ncbi:DUF4381 domain-containing protein [Marinomonas algarum]|uniref:DUF4381 domain-containing protein n=1 Tax=Marinomonas algarum TaxID=2883105 RepID=A0A9X1LCS5_9GAMM|nr:DUF4381 domain-containing protein [Marinomonas algarum]MCB5162404.1 DUF4381 domain-containing protein [Marinomonas algarum]